MTEERKCNLCGRSVMNGNGANSHIMTESSNSKRAINIPGSKLYRTDGKNVMDANKQLKHNGLLCRDCDSRLGTWEGERSRLFGKILSRDDFDETGMRLTSGYKQDYIVAACLADVFRASVTNRDAFSGVSLGVKHELRIKEILNGFLRDLN